MNDSSRAVSLAIYDKLCPVTMKRHDWRHATDAPGWKLCDYCVRCESCQLKAIVPSPHDMGA